MTDRATVAVLGGGIAGAAVAYHLARRGLGAVVLVEPRTPAAGASGRAAGIVTEQMWDRWDFDVVRETREEYRALADRLDPTAYRTNGFVRWTSSADAAEALADAERRLRGWGASVRPIAPDELAARLPAVRTHGVRAASFDPDDAVVAPSRLTELYFRRAADAGVEAVVGDGFRSLARSGTGWSIATQHRSLAARQVVVAAGAWSKRLVAGAGGTLPLAPYRTQAAVLRPALPAPADLPSGHDLDLDVYVRPEEAGRVLAGDGTRLVEVDPATDPPGADEAFVAGIARAFADRFPGWADAELVRAWAGVCGSTPDRRPLVGPAADLPGLYLLTGFNGFGVMRAGGAARRLADVIAGDGERAIERIAPVRPDRFAGPASPFGPRPGFTLEGGRDPRY